MRIFPTRGFAIVSAVFLLVILAAVGVAMVTFSTSQQTSSGMDVMGSRAYQAARAGIEWALYERLNQQVSQPGVSPKYCFTSSSGGTAFTKTFAMPTGTTLSPFTVTVQCTAYSIPAIPAANAVVVRTITSCACTQPSGGVCSCPLTTAPPTPDFVERQVQITLQEPY